MPGNARQLTVDDARAHLRSQCLAPSPTTGRVGLECEWHVVRANEPCAVVPLEELRAEMAALGPLPGGSAITYEPGGQLELSGPALDGASASAAVTAMTADVDTVRRHLGRVDIALVGTGVDALRPSQRLLCAPRYDAMEAYFDSFGRHGRVMMTRTAALQINLDNGRDADEIERRWRRVHILGPTLVAAFANSPLACGLPTGWRSTRLANWWAMDGTRTAPFGDRHRLEDWPDAALDARLMFVHADDEHYVPMIEPITFREWILCGHDVGDGVGVGYPTLDDLDYHLTTLFPPVRPRGWLEIRYLDALPDPWWRVAAAVVTTLIDDPAVAVVAEHVARPTARRWMSAARHALSDPALARSARACFQLAIDAMVRRGVDDALTVCCAEYAERWVFVGRTPADDLLDAWSARWSAPASTPANGLKEHAWV